MAIFIFDQPQRHNGTAKAKSRVQFTLIPDRGYGRIHLACFGNRGHYSPEDGSCVHVVGVTASMKGWHLRRSWYLPWGAPGTEHRRVPMAAPQGGRK